MSRDMPEDSSGGYVVGYLPRFAVAFDPFRALLAAHDCDSVWPLSSLLLSWLICLRALAGLEPARVPLGLAGQAVRRLISSSVSVSVASLLVMAFRLGVLMYTP